MPQLADLVKKRTDKKFVKKEYRPWDLSGSGTLDEANYIKQTDDSVTCQQQIENLVVINGCMNLSSSESQNASEEGKIIDNILGNNQVTNRQQLGNKQVTQQKQPDNLQITTRKQIEDETDNELKHYDDTILLGDDIRKLTGIQKKIFFYIVRLCISRGNLETGTILTNDLTIVANCSFGSAKTSLSRLIKKGLIIRKKGKQSRGKHIVLGITKRIQAAALQAECFNVNPIMKSIDNINGNKTDNTMLHNSSSYLNIT